MKNESILYNFILSLLALIPTIVLLFQLWKKRKINKRNKNDLSDFVTHKRLKKYKKNFVRTFCVDEPPEDEDEPKVSNEHANRVDLINFFDEQVFNNSNKKIYLILGGAGMGKTTFMINLFLHYNSKRFKNRYKIKYIPLDRTDSDNFIEKYKKDDSPYEDGGETILLLDAFDEDPNIVDDYKDRFDQLIKSTITYRKVVITSRTHFFPKQSEENFREVYRTEDENNDYRIRIRKYISPFSEKDIQKYLKKKYGPKFEILGDWRYLNTDRKKAEKIVEMSSNLVVRPMLLDNIDLLLNSNKEFQYEHEIYEEFINQWIKREFSKQPTKTVDGFDSHMHMVMLKSARNVYHNYILGKGLFVEEDFLMDIDKDATIRLNALTVKSRSLLNRNPGGRYKFSHKTILEFLLAKIDSSTIVVNQFVDFSNFDFGVRLRNQILFNNLCSSAKGLFISKFNNGYFLPANKKNYNSEIESEMIFGLYFNELDLRKLRIFKKLKTVYFVNEYLEFPNIESVRVRGDTSSFGFGGRTIPIEVVSNLEQKVVYKLDVIKIPYKQDKFLNSLKINIYRLMVKRKNNNTEE